MTLKLTLYKSKDGWRVRAIGRNGRKVLTGEAYASRSNCLRAARRIVGAKVVMG